MAMNMTLHFSANAKSDIIPFKGVPSTFLNLKIGSSCGRDTILNVVLQRYAELIAHFFVFIFQVLLSSATTFSDWRMARVVLTFKEGNRLSLTNYRAV